MYYFKFSVYKILLTLSFSLVSSVVWSQQESPAEAIEQESNEPESQDIELVDNSEFAPLIFDPVLIQNVELNDNDVSGGARLGTIELSSLPSTSNSPSSGRPKSTQINRGQLDSSITQFQDSILQFELEGGVYDYRLSELYLSLGNTYQQLDESQLAIDAFNEALQLSRITSGLFTEDQLPIVEELVESYLNLGDIPSANLNQEYLFYINQKIYGAAHPVILTGLLEYADWNLYSASLSMGYIPNLQTLHFRTDSFNEQNFNNLIQSQPTQDYLSAATFAYSQAIIIQHDLEVIFNETPSSVEIDEMKNNLNFSDEDFNIPDAEKKLAYTYFLQYQFDFNNIGVNSFGEAPGNYFLNSYTNGKAALERRYSYMQDAGSSPLDIIQALLDIADWFLFFERWSSAKDLYIQVFNLMESNGIEKINGLAYPDLPAYIPSFLSPPYTRDSNRLSHEEKLEYEGYIDVSFTLTRFARPASIRIVSKSEGTNQATERALIRKLRYSTYRLQLEDQTEYSSNSYLVRYYYTAQLSDE